MTQKSRRRTLAVGGLSFAILMLQTSYTRAEDPTPASQDLSALSLEQLTRMEVSSVSRRDQLLYKTAAAVFVITQEDIRRSGASNIPELLRIVPGIQVAQVEANKWAVSARGFNGIFADKMLVMIDSRTVYTSIYSGVFWDQNEVPLEDIERIEVIRGPGATMWGANAVNGVINIITKKAKDAIGTQVVVTEGSIDRLASLRYGGESKKDFQYNVFLQDLRRLALVDASDNSSHDAGNSLRGGGRIDLQAGKSDWLTLHGDMYRGREDQNVQIASVTDTGYSQSVIQDKAQNSGGYALARWEHKMQGADFALQAYYNDQNRKENKGYGREGTIDFDFQNHVAIDGRNDVTWGLGFRQNHDHIRGVVVPFAHPTHESLLVSSFVQDEFSVLPNKVVLTAGSKFSWNSYTHLEIQPNLRLIYTPDETHSIWTSVSRAVRTPSVVDEDLRAYFPMPSASPLPTQLLIQGNPSIKSEATLDYEGGYRQQFGKHLSGDLAGFYSRYTNLVAQVQMTPYVTQSLDPSIIVPFIYENDFKAASQGIEASFSWTPVRTLRIDSSYAVLQARCAQSGGPAGLVTQELSWSTPRNTENMRASWDFARHWTTDASLGLVSETPVYDDGSPVASQRVKPYQRGDFGVAYSLNEHALIRFGAHNLQSSRHLEFNPQDQYDVASEIPRSFFGKLVWSF